MRNYFKEIIVDTDITNWHLLFFLLLVNLIIMVVLNNYILTREFYDAIYSNKFDPTLIDFLYALKLKFGLWKYLTSPILVLIKVVFVALVLQSSLMIRFIDIPFSKIFRISLIGFAVLTLVPIAQVINLSIVPLESITDKSLNSIPFSLASFIDVKNSMNNSLISILGMINIFEVLWIIAIAFALREIPNLTKMNSFITSFSVWSLIFLFQIGLVLFTSHILR